MWWPTCYPVTSTHYNLRCIIFVCVSGRHTVVWMMHIEKLYWLCLALTRLWSTNNLIYQLHMRWLIVCWCASHSQYHKAIMHCNPVVFITWDVFKAEMSMYWYCWQLMWDSVLYAVESISAFAWEPVGHRFACIHGDAPRISVSFYNVRKGGSVEILSTAVSLSLCDLLLIWLLSYSHHLCHHLSFCCSTYA